ncbi:topoisomerase [Sporosarcina sp. Te-1]|uniref:topoisomerase n=1 Tax=Sporosarcina sp. Te-1 TaxID=2818390 RepID=UPI001A9E4FC2|nr:topoisomerase [Sporosarcina sp. Te-1]QTD40354.1 topoisomerase [Sporosarcina sp. Te-1]
MRDISVKKILISGIVFGSILLGGCNEEKEKTSELVLTYSEQEVVGEKDNTELLLDLKNVIIDSIEEQTGIDSESIVIMVGGSPDIIDVSVSFPKDVKVDDTMIQQIAEDSIKKFSETESIKINEENISIKIEKY